MPWQHVFLQRMKFRLKMAFEKRLFVAIIDTLNENGDTIILIKIGKLG